MTIQVLKGPPVIRIEMTHALRFSLTCVARSKHRSITSLLHRIFQLSELERDKSILQNWAYAVTTA